MWGIVAANAQHGKVVSQLAFRLQIDYCPSVKVH